MKILIICGSPRKGNTEYLCNKFIEAVKEEGADTELVLLKDMEIAECIGCDACYGTSMECNFDDDMENLIEEMLKADMIVFATPNYFDNVSGLMKIFMDRTNPICSPPKLKGKKAFIICVGGQSYENSIKYCEEALKHFIDIHEMNLVGSFHERADELGEVAKNIKLIKKLQEKAREIIK